MSKLTKSFEIMVTATLRKNLGPSVLKHNDDSCLQEDKAPQAACTSVSCQIDVVNKQPFSPVS